MQNKLFGSSLAKTWNFQMVMNFLQKAHWIHERTWRYDYTGIRGTNQENLHLTEEISFPMPAVE